MYDIKEIGMVPPPFGGVSVYVGRLIDRLSEDGWTVGGYYVSESSLEGKNRRLFDRWTWLETRKFPYKVFRFLGQCRKYRIIHSHLGLEAMIYLWSAKVVLGKRIIITIHNSMVTDYYADTNRINRFFLRLMAKDDAVRWIAVSEEGKRQLENLPFRFASGISVVTPFIPEVPAGHKLSGPMSEYLRRHGKNLVFYGHGFMSNKGVDVYGFREMLDIYQAVLKCEPDVGLVYCIADVSNQDALQELESYAGDLGVADSIFWQLGGMDSMAPLWALADVYVRPTRTDGDSVAVREALGSGVRVVASNVVRRPGSCLLFPAGDVEAACRCIMQAFSAGRSDRSDVDDAHYQLMRRIYQ